MFEGGPGSREEGTVAATRDQQPEIFVAKGFVLECPDDKN